MGEVASTLLALLERDSTLLVEHDPEWPSPCEILPPDAQGMVRWRPVAMVPPPDFGDVEAEVGFSLAPDVKEFYGSYFGRVEELRYRGRTVLLNVLWNPEELALWKRNIVEHLRVCPAISGPLSVFVANTDSDPFYSVDNTTNAVLLEEPDWPRSTVVAPSLASFLNELR